MERRLRVQVSDTEHEQQSQLQPRFKARYLRVLEALRPRERAMLCGLLKVPRSTHLCGSDELQSTYGMPASTMLSLDQLPLEILQAISHYLDIPDILQLRRVSRYLNDVSHYRDLWKDAYCKAEFVHPPGPFPSQSAHDLEKALVTSFRVHRNLRRTSKMEIPTHKLRNIQYTETMSTCGLQLFHCASAMDSEGRPFACVVLNEATQVTGQISIYLLNVGERSTVTLDLLHQFEHSSFDIHDVDLGPRVIVIQSQGDRDLNANWCLIALDLHTLTQFLLPSANHVMRDAAEMLEWRPIIHTTSPKIISTSTYVLIAMSFYIQGAGWSTFFQAFPVPPPLTHHHSTPTLMPLSASHQGLISGINIRLSGTILLHDAVLDSFTQDVLIAIRVHAFQPSYPYSSLAKHGILRLSAAPTSNDGEIGTITFQLHGPLGYPGTPFLHPSFNGTGRVFYTLNANPYRIVTALEYDLHARGNGNDDEHVAKVTEYPSILGFPTLHRLVDYDPYSGRICLQSVVATDGVVEIVDVAI